MCRQNTCFNITKFPFIHKIIFQWTDYIQANLVIFNDNTMVLFNNISDCFIREYCSVG